MNGPRLGHDAHLRRFIAGLRAELVFLLGEKDRYRIEHMSVERLLQLKGHTLERLMAAPGPRREH